MLCPNSAGTDKNVKFFRDLLASYISAENKKIAVTWAQLFPTLLKPNHCLRRFWQVFCPKLKTKLRVFCSLSLCLFFFFFCFCFAFSRVRKNFTQSSCETSDACHIFPAKWSRVCVIVFVVAPAPYPHLSKTVLSSNHCTSATVSRLHCPCGLFSKLFCIKILHELHAGPMLHNLIEHHKFNSIHLWCRFTLLCSCSLKPQTLPAKTDNAAWLIFWFPPNILLFVGNEFQKRQMFIYTRVCKSFCVVGSVLCWIHCLFYDWVSVCLPKKVMSYHQIGTTENLHPCKVVHSGKLQRLLSQKTKEVGVPPKLIGTSFSPPSWHEGRTQSKAQIDQSLIAQSGTLRTNHKCCWAKGGGCITKIEWKKFPRNPADTKVEQGSN